MFTFRKFFNLTKPTFLIYKLRVTMFSLQASGIVKIPSSNRL